MHLKKQQVWKAILVLCAKLGPVWVKCFLGNETAIKGGRLALSDI